MTSQLAKQLGACIRDLRLQTGLSQVEFGERCGFYQTYLSRIENGRANPTINAIEVIANTLGMTVFELFEQVREQMPVRKGRKVRPVDRKTESSPMAKSKKELAIARLLRETANDDPPLTVEEATAMVEAKERKKELDAQIKRAKQLMKKAEIETLTKDERAEYGRLMKGGFDGLIDQYVAIADRLFRSGRKSKTQ